jgi:hypothetical protein
MLKNSANPIKYKAYMIKNKIIPGDLLAKTADQCYIGFVD